MAIPSRITSTGRPKLHTFDALRNRSFRFLWPLNFFSYFTRWMQMTALAWMVLDLTDSPWLVALVGFFGMVPMLLLGIVGGALADRVDRKRLILATQLANLVAAGSMAVLLATGAAAFWHAYLIVLVVGTGSALDGPSRRSSIHDLLGRAGVTNAVALDSMAMHASRMLGPAVGGGLISLIDVTGVYVVVTVIYVLALALVRPLRLPAPPRLRSIATGATLAEGATSAGGHEAVASHPGIREILRNLFEGLRYVSGQHLILATVLVTVLMNLLLFPYMQMVPVVARDVLGVGPGLMGVLMASDGLGALLGSTLIASVGTITHHGRVYMGGSMIGLVMLLLFAFSETYGLSLTLLLLLGLGTAGFGAMQATIVMLVSREEMRGRALGVISVAIGAGPLGALMIGVFATAWGATSAIAVLAILGMVSLSLVALLMPSLRQRILAQEETSSETHPAPQKAA